VGFELDANGKDVWLRSVELAKSAQISDEIFSHLPVDVNAHFVDKCSPNKLQVDSLSPFCAQSVFSLSAKYNDGALSCACNAEGSESTERCELFGGQCQCKPNIIGRDCSACKTGYYDFPNCQKCNCETGICDDAGKCVEPPNSINNECLDGFYGFHPKFGCEPCNCTTEGTLNGDQVCDKTSGQCTCKVNVGGLKCETCQAGFYDYPTCNLCDCDVNGTLASVCIMQTAQCECKENVEGARCDYCKQGTFNLEERNAKGCTSCFCFGQTAQCRPSDLYLASVGNLNAAEWSLDLARSSTTSQSSLLANLKISQSQDETGFRLEADEANKDEKLEEAIYWNAPSTFVRQTASTSAGSVSSSGAKVPKKAAVEKDPNAPKKVRVKKTAVVPVVEEVPVVVEEIPVVVEEVPVVVEEVRVATPVMEDKKVKVKKVKKTTKVLVDVPSEK